ncbi:UNVERIFIED_CONTAM: putative alpha,alpha-trehalose-phosphate synthase [UDP-forming] 10 [Sesamum angustifolium]|uniref:Alpha,alpha-trehalose-phosphate synthase [UDP-forming] 10 n=1 Tax=Sesamum angustifolium TaxID=2727405 RepID=A0AAW2MUP5_9LAMI
MGKTGIRVESASTCNKVKEIQEQFKGKKVILGVDDMDIFKGISLKLLAFEQLLEQQKEFARRKPRCSGYSESGRAKDVQKEKILNYCFAANHHAECRKQLRHENTTVMLGSQLHAGLGEACRITMISVVGALASGLGSESYSLSQVFRKLSVDHIVSAYKRTRKERYFWTMMWERKSSLSDWLAPCEKLGLAAEHGFFLRWDKTSEWESLAADLDWKEIVEPIMKLYTEATDGSSMEAKELLDHLENVLANEPAVVRRGQHIVEVKPQGVTKGSVAEKVLSTLASNGRAPDFVVCIGDDRSDEDMFESILNAVSGSSLPAVPEIFACTVGQKPSKAKYYLDDTGDVVRLLRGLANASNPKPRDSAQFQVSFDSVF